MGRTPPQRPWTLLATMAVGLAIAAFLGWGIWEQVDRLHAIQATEAQLAPYLEQQRARNEVLLKTLEKVSSPEYVEEGARVYFGMVRPGEVRVVVPPAEEPPTPPPAHTPAQPHTSPPLWQRIQRWLFGHL